MCTERDEKGRFQKGYGGGPGRPPRAVEIDYLVALADCVSEDDWGRIAKRAVADAIKGDAKARDWLSRYLLGTRTALDPPVVAPGEQKLVIEIEHVDDFYGELSKEQQERVAASRKHYEETGKVLVPELRSEGWNNQQQGKAGAVTQLGQTG